MRPLQPCGTPAAYQRHKRRGEPACDACQKAIADYLREYRATSPVYQAIHQRHHQARYSALAHLAREYPARYRELLTAYKQGTEPGQPDTPEWQEIRRTVLEREGR